MLILRSTHERLMSSLERVLNEKDARIAALEKMVWSPTSATHIPLVQMEADAVLSQKESVIELDQLELERARAIDEEAIRLLSAEF